MSKLKAVAGASLLIISIILYVYIAYYVPSTDPSIINVLDDKAPWLHKHIVSLISRENVLKDKQLWFPMGKDVYSMPVILDVIAVKLGVDTGSLYLVTMASGALIVVFAYITGYLVFREHIAAGIASLLTVLAPAFIYWFKANMYGAYLGLAIGYLSILLLSVAIKRESLPLSIASTIIAVLAWLSWSSGWIVLLMVAVYGLVLVYNGCYRVKTLLYTMVLLTIATMPLNLLLGIKYILVYHVISYSMLLLTTILYIVGNRVEKRIRIDVYKGVWRISSSAMIIVISLTIAYIVSFFTRIPGFMEIYVKPYRPLTDYMSIAVLAPFALVLFLRAGYLSNIGSKPLETMIVTGFILGILLSVVDPSLTVLAILCISPLIAYSLERLVTIVFLLKKKVKYLLLAATIWIIIASILANGIASYRIASSEPAIYYGPVPRELVISIPKNSSLLLTLDYIDSSKAILLTYWGRSHWVVGYRDNIYVLADDHGPVRNQILLSKIFMSNEYLALGLINNTIVREYGVKDVYILLSEVITVEKSKVFGVRGAHIGRPIVLPTRIGRQEVKYVPLDDVAHILMYIGLAGYKPEEFLDPTKATYSFELSLAWKEGMRKTLFFSLLITAINKLGYNAINDVYSTSPIYLLDIEKPKRIVFVNGTLTYLYTVPTELADYEVYWMTALFKVELE